MSTSYYGHANIIKYCNRPFSSIEEMDEEIIKRHNEVAPSDGTVIHAGDFTLANVEIANQYIKRLNGHHIFLRGSHDKWLKANTRVHEIWCNKIEDLYVVICHYAMRVWARSHYNSILLFGHSHGKLEPIGKQLDIGVDLHNFYPYSFEEIKSIMATIHNDITVYASSRTAE